MAGNWSRDLGGDRSSGRLPCPVQGLSSSPSSHTGIVSDVPGRLSSGSSLAARGRGDACQRSLRNRPRSGSRLLQSSLPGGEGDWRLEACDRSLAFERLRPVDAVQDGTVTSVLLSVREGDFLASLDLKDAYFQIPIHGSSRKLLMFMSEGTVYQFKALCFGLSTAPQVFTRVFAAVSAWAHARGIRLLRYLDDWLVLSSSEKKAKESIRELLSLCRTLGIVINEKKSDLVPSQSAKYLGMTIDTGAGKVLPVSSKSREVPCGSGEILFHAISPSPALAGDLGSPGFAGAVGSSRSTSMRSLQWHLKSQWSPESDPPSLPVALPEEARRDLSWWMVRDHLLVGVRFGTPAPDLHLYSDASSSGWGAHLLDQNVSGVWSAQEKLLHINLLEMKALFLALQAFQEDVAGHHVTAMCDNSTVVAYVNKQGGTVSRPLCLLTSRLLRWTEFFDVHLEARYLPGESNVLADVLSRRGASCGDRVVSPPSGGEGTSSYVGQSVDRPVRDLPQLEAAPVLLACPGSTGRLRGCVSSSLGRPGSLRVPSLCSGRSGDRSRPAVIASRDDSGRTSLAREGVVRRLAASTDPTTLVLPCWDRLLRQPHCNLFHQGAHALNLHAWRLSSDTTESRAFREGLLESCQGSSENLPLACTSRDGRSSVVGVMEGALLQSTPLFL